MSDTLTVLREIVPDAHDLAMIMAATIDDGGPDDGHVVHLCIAHGGHYWVCETCEAQGFAENVPPGDWKVTVEPGTPADAPLVRVDKATATLTMAPGVRLEKVRDAAPQEIVDAAADWHADL